MGRYAAGTAAARNKSSQKQQQPMPQIITQQ
jgi:hypothetical protein